MFYKRWLIGHQIDDKNTIIFWNTMGMENFFKKIVTRVAFLTADLLYNQKGLKTLSQKPKTECITLKNKQSWKFC